MIDRIHDFWCKLFHRPGYPINNQYICPDCQRVHKVTWVDPVQGQRWNVYAPK